MKLGSLFDGSGGFPLAGALFGIDAAYSKKLWDITNLFANRQTGKQSEERSTKQSTDTQEVQESTKSI